MTFKLYQYDKKVWDNNEVSHTWQFGAIGNKSLLWVDYETPGGIIHSSGGLHIFFRLFTSSSFLEIDFQQRNFCLAFAFFSNYFEGWE